MEIKQKPPTDLEIAEAVALMQSGLVKDTEFLRDTLRLERGMPVFNSWQHRGFQTFDDHRNATAPCEPIAVHGEGE